MGHGSNGSSWPKDVFTLQWFKEFPKYTWTNDSRLQQDGVIQYTIGKDHNMFGTNLLRIKGTISSCKHWTRKTNSSLECSNSRLEGQNEIAKV
jgi:hypothetical protein